MDGPAVTRRAPNAIWKTSKALLTETELKEPVLGGRRGGKKASEKAKVGTDDGRWTNAGRMPKSDHKTGLKARRLIRESSGLGGPKHATEVRDSQVEEGGNEATKKHNPRLWS